MKVNLGSGAFHRLSCCIAVSLAAMLCSSAARASVAVLLEEPYGRLGAWSPSGHSAVYLDHVCAATPLRLRPCLPGELGAVISRYHGIGSRDWIAIPLLAYLYSVDRAEDIPLSVDRHDVALLRDAYRRKYLQDVAPDIQDGAAPPGNWYEMVGAAFDRTIFGLQVESTKEQDAALIAFLNDHQNSSVYNGAFRNCADFARTTVNRFYPHAVRRNYIADLGLTSPKSVARGLSHYAAKHPEIQFAQFQIAQVSGDLPHSQPAVTLTEGILKEFGVPLLIVSPIAAGAVAIAYVVHGRFNEPRDAPVLNLRKDSPARDVIGFNESAMSASAGTAAQSAWSSSASQPPSGIGKERSAP